MNKLHKTLYLGFSIIVTIILILAVVFFFKVIKNKNQHTGSVLTVLDNKIIEKENIDFLSKKIDAIKVTHESVNSHFVDPTKIDNFVGYLENLGDSNGAKLSVKNVEASKNKEDNMISVEINIEGPFPSIMKIIGLLENSPYQIYINSTYLNRDIEPVKEGEIIKTPIPKIKTWKATVAFNILKIK